jgi:hypothetical protein
MNAENTAASSGFMRVAKPVKPSIPPLLTRERGEVAVSYGDLGRGVSPPRSGTRQRRCAMLPLLASAPRASGRPCVVAGWEWVRFMAAVAAALVKFARVNSSSELAVRSLSGSGARRLIAT